MVDPKVWVRTSRLSYGTNQHGSEVRKNPKDDFSAILPYRDSWRTGPVSVRSCSAGYCKFAVRQSLRPSVGNTADVGNR
jgi:hypothetical protein